VATLGTAGAGEAAGQDAALQIASKFPLHVAGYRVPIAVASASLSPLTAKATDGDDSRHRTLRH
jgi:hypothetical protein